MSLTPITAAAAELAGVGIAGVMRPAADPAKTTASAIAKAITKGSGFKAEVDPKKDQ